MVTAHCLYLKLRPRNGNTCYFHLPALLIPRTGTHSLGQSHNHSSSSFSPQRIYQFGTWSEVRGHRGSSRLSNCQPRTPYQYLKKSSESPTSSCLYVWLEWSLPVLAKGSALRSPVRPAMPARSAVTLLRKESRVQIVHKMRRPAKFTASSRQRKWINPFRISIMFMSRAQQSARSIDSAHSTSRGSCPQVDRSIPFDAVLRFGPPCRGPAPG